MSTIQIWAIWFLFWGSVIFVMVAIFQEISRKERVLRHYEGFKDWSTRMLKFYVEKVELMIDMGTETDTDIEALEAAKLVLRKREADKTIKL